MIQLFNFREDYYDMKAWLGERGLDAPHPDSMPSTGFIATIDGIPSAVAFLRMIEGNQGKLDYLVSNPHQPPATRFQAIDLVVDAVIQLAKDLKLNELYAHSQEDSLLRRCALKGFESFPHTLIAMNLRSASRQI